MFGVARSRTGSPARFIIALIVAVISVVGYYGARQFNPVTGETQHVSLSTDQEIALGLQAAPELAQQFGGRSRDSEGQALVERVGKRIVSGSAAKDTPYRWGFHLLDDDETINAFALPGGQVFITEALARKLESEAELAAVLGHEVAHVIGRHGAEHLAKGRLIQGLGGAAVIASYDPDNPGSSVRNQAIAAAVAQLVNMKFGREDELESDRLGVRFMGEAGYDPRAMLRVMEVLAESAKGGGSRPEFFSTHPNPDRRMERIREAIQKEFPNGVPGGLER
jgi:beta-barrel assembly-enhancing protease